MCVYEIEREGGRRGGGGKGVLILESVTLTSLIKHIMHNVGVVMYISSQIRSVYTQYTHTNLTCANSLARSLIDELPLLYLSQTSAKLSWTERNSLIEPSS